MVKVRLKIRDSEVHQPQHYLPNSTWSHGPYNSVWYYWVPLWMWFSDSAPLTLYYCTKRVKSTRGTTKRLNITLQFWCSVLPKFGNTCMHIYRMYHSNTAMVGPGCSRTLEQLGLVVSSVCVSREMKPFSHILPNAAISLNSFVPLIFIKERGK